MERMFDRACKVVTHDSKFAHVRTPHKQILIP